jgi:ribosomal protein L16 Arg81 hydroxylase
MLGDIPTFMRNYWRTRPYFAPGAAAGFGLSYSEQQYLKDLVASQRPPYLSVSSRDGTRIFGTHDTAEDLRASLLAGAVSAIKASRTWHGPAPDSWQWMKLLFGSLCRAVAMLYMSPQYSEDVDIFLAGPQSGLGTHFDTTDVFTIQIEGQRKWTVEDHADVRSVLQLTTRPDWYPAKEIGFQGSTREITLQAGDALYVPAYCVHRVTGISWSVSVAMGLRAFNEIDVVEHLLETIRLQHFAEYPPLRSESESSGDAQADAKSELIERVRALLSRVEMAAFGAVLSPLKLPADFQGGIQEPSSEVPGPYRSGFAIRNEPRR